MNISRIRRNSDTLGIVASSLCLIHCLITPFLFAAQAGTALLRDANSIWWKSLDIIFLGLSFIAIHKSIKTTSSQKMKYAFGIAWFLLFIIVINEKLLLFPLREEAIYFASLLLVILHFYNLKYCTANKNVVTVK